MKLPKHSAVVAILSGVLALCGIRCSQYEYASPLPGLIEVRLKTLSSKIAFVPLNNFVLKVSSVEAIESNNARVVIYEDPRAKERTTNPYNTLDFRARDSSLIIGQSYAPPGDYTGINLLVKPGTEIILDGYRFIDVSTPETFDPYLVFRKGFHVSESMVTKITLTIDLDASLIQHTTFYEFRPVYYISSSQ